MLVIDWNCRGFWGILRGVYFADNSVFFGHGIWIGMLAWQLLGLTAKNNADMQKFRQFQTAMPMHNTVVYRLDVADGVQALKVLEF